MQLVRNLPILAFIAQLRHPERCHCQLIDKGSSITKDASCSLQKIIAVIQQIHED